MIILQWILQGVVRMGQYTMTWFAIFLIIAILCLVISVLFPRWHRA